MGLLPGLDFVERLKALLELRLEALLNSIVASALTL